MELAKIIIRSRDYLDKFTYDDYPVCFEEFSRKASFFLDDLQKSSINAAADELIGCLERERTLLKRRDASKALFLDKQVIALFLSPCCKKAGGKADTFAAVLLEKWNAKYPKNKYYLGTYEDIMKGFDANLLGLPLRKSSKNRR